MTEFLSYTGTYDKDTDLVKFTGPGVKYASANIPLYSQMPDWKHIVVENNVTEFKGEKVQFVGVTSVGTKGLTTNSIGAKKGDGTTLFAGAGNTAVGTEIVSMVRDGASSATTNIGSLFGIKLEKTGITSLAGNINILVTK